MIHIMILGNSNKIIADFCPYVAACARTRTPPAQRLGLRGESDAILSPVFFILKKNKRHFNMATAYKQNYSFIGHSY